MTHACASNPCPICRPTPVFFATTGGWGIEPMPGLLKTVYTTGDAMEFIGGPLNDDQAAEVNSLVVHMRGDGRSEAGAYIRDEVGTFVWEPRSTVNAAGQRVEYDYRARDFACDAPKDL